MAIDAFRIQNFMGFEDSGWIEFKSLNLIFGRNSTGKSSIIRALLLLKQSQDSPERFGPLLFVDEDGYDFGSFRALVTDHDVTREIVFGFRHRFSLPIELVQRRYFIQDETVDSSDTSRTFNEYDYIIETRLVDALRSYWEDFAHKTNENEIEFIIHTQVAYKADTSTNRANLSKLELMDGNDEVLVKISLAVGDSQTEEWSIDSDFPESVTEWPPIELFTRKSFFPSFRIKDGEEYFIDEYYEPGRVVVPQSDDTFAYFPLFLRTLYPEIKSFVNIVYLGPLRPEPQRFYYVPGRTLTRNAGHRVIQAFLDAGANSEQEARLEFIRSWLLSSLGISIEVNPIRSDAQNSIPLYEVNIVESHEEEVNSSGTTANIREVGSGLAQVLPVIIEAALLSPGTMIIVEQPELHLHPNAQAELGDLLIGAAKFGVNFLLETHSENLLLRVRRRIAETTANAITDSDKRLTLEELGTYFVNRESNRSVIYHVPFDEWGDYVTRPPGFGDFFGQDYEELTKMKRARLGVRRQ